MRTVRKLLLILALTAAAAAVLAWYAARTPSAAIWEAAHGLKTCDFQAVEHGIDIGAVTTGLADELLGSPELAKKMAAALGPGPGTMLASGLGAMMKPMLGAMAGGVVREFVSKCKLFGVLDGPLTALAPLAAFLRRPLGPETAALIAWWHTGAGTADGHVVMSIPVKDGTLTVELSRDDVHWRVTGAPGALALMTRQRAP